MWTLLLWPISDRGRRFYLYPSGHTSPFLSCTVFPGFISESWLCWLLASESFLHLYPCFQLPNIANSTTYGNKQLSERAEVQMRWQQDTLTSIRQTMLTGLQIHLWSFNVNTILYSKGRSSLWVCLHHLWGWCPAAFWRYTLCFISVPLRCF